ncbi:hypothetical protein R69608_05139 [Paraburkholderia nemoris]|nr:hypothetical protein R69608_05139 [Paraburkholderia nemoris]
MFKHCLLGSLVALALCACNTVTPVTNETTGPTITFSQTNVGTVTSLSYNADTSTQSFFNAVATDSGGVKSINLSFSQSVPDCTTVSGGGYTGSYSYSPVPPAESSSSTPDSSGQVPTELFTATTLQGPYTCTIPGISDPARPYGQTINATVTATNYSGISTTATLPINFYTWP